MFANSIEECIDTTKLYVLPDGYIYGYSSLTEPISSYSNLADPLPENTTDTTKWVNGYRIDSSGNYIQQDNSTISNTISCERGAIIRIKGVTLRENVDRLCFSYIRSGEIRTDFCGYFNLGLPKDGYGVVYNGLENGVYTFTIEKETNLEIFEFRFAMQTPIDVNSIIVTINEEITTESVTSYRWINTGHAFVPMDYEDRINELEEDVLNIKVKVETCDSNSSKTMTIPSYWESMVANKTEVIKDLQKAGGKDCVCFAWAADTHIPDNDGGRTNNLGKVMAKMCDNCEIPFAILSGDINTRSSYSTEEKLINSHAQLLAHLAPLWGTERLLMALGNHDGTWGDSTAYYGHQFTPERMWQIFFRSQALDFRKVFSDDGLYYYVDNIPQKTRFIVLNSHFGGEYAEDENGLAVNNRFRTSCYGQAQLDWLANMALDMPEGYGAIIVAHVPPNITYTVDKEQFIGIVNAYCDKATYSGSFAGVDGWTSNSISVDFTTSAKGEIIAMFTGHVHGDSIDTKTMACPLLTILSAGATPNEPYSETAPTRTFETDTETNFDIVTINKATRTIYCTRVGAGDDREVNY